MGFKLSVGLTFALISFSYEAFIGDIYVKDDDDSSMFVSNLGVSVADGVRLSNPNLLWPGGRVYYKFDPSFRGKKGHDLVQKMMDYIESQFKLQSSETACIVFEKLHDTRKTRNDYLLITADGGGLGHGPDCFSQLGWQTGEQILNLGSSCLTPALVLHELLHTLGFTHEMNRPDRDDFLVVDYDNIFENRKHNYIKRTDTKPEDFDEDYSSDVHTGLTPFDVSSVLMYPPEKTVIHTKNGKQAIKYRTQPSMSWPNPKTEDLLSAIDKVEVSTAYECEIGQTLMVDYIHLNRLSTRSRLENVTQEKNKNDEKKFHILAEKIRENIKGKKSLKNDFTEAKKTIGKLENKIKKQENQISTLEEQNTKQKEQIRNLLEDHDQTNAMVKRLETLLNDLISRVENPCTDDPCGPNSECASALGVVTCSCLSGYEGSPPNCRTPYLYLGISKTVELPSFSPVTSCHVPEYPVQGLSYVVTAIVGGGIMVCGGRNGSGDYQSGCYSLQGGVWTTQPSMQEKRSFAAASMTDKGLFVTGGTGRYVHSSTEYLSSDGWVYGPPLPVVMSSHCQVSVGRVVIISGGYIGDDDTVASRSLATVYKLESGVWTKLPDMQQARRRHSCAVFGGHLFIIGGYDDVHGAKTSVEIMNISSGMWTVGQSLTAEHFYGQAVVHHSVLYVLNYDGKVVKLTEGDEQGFEWAEWEDLTNIGSIGIRAVFPAPLVTLGMLGC